MTDKEKDLDGELSGMLRGVPPQNILISFGDKPAKSLADHLKDQQKRQKKRKPKDKERER